MAASVPAEFDMTSACSEVIMWLKEQSEQVDAAGRPKCSDVPAVLAKHFRPDQGDVLTKQLAADLKELEQQCLRAVKAKDPVKRAAHLTMVPAPPLASVDGDGEVALQQHALRVWQLGFLEVYSFKGASSLYAVLEVVKVNLTGANGKQTQKYPLEILFDLGHALPASGSPIQDFSVGTANGFAVVLGSYLCCIVAAMRGWMKPDSSLTPTVRAALGVKLLKCLRLYATYAPKGDLRAQAQITLSTKIQAANRSRPTTLQMLFVFERVVQGEVVSGSRKSRGTLLQEALNDYNKQERVRTLRIYNDELTAIRFLSERTSAFRDLLKVVWGAERPQYTAMPMNLLASDWLQESAALPVPTPHVLLMHAWRLQSITQDV